MRQSTFYRALAFFLPVAALLTGSLVIVYAAVQHIYRSSANDPQLQMATDDAHLLDMGMRPSRLVGGRSVDLARSLSVHSSVYDRTGRLLASNARLGGAPPTPPRGVLDTARIDGKNILTWQPGPGVRVAAVVLPWKGGTVLVGRSLGPTEDRERDLELILGGGWILGLAGLGAVALVSAWLWPRYAT